MVGERNEEKGELEVDWWLTQTSKVHLFSFLLPHPPFFSLHNFDDTNLHKQTNILLLHSRMLSAKRSSLYSPGLSRDRYFHDKENMDEKMTIHVNLTFHCLFYVLKWLSLIFGS